MQKTSRICTVALFFTLLCVNPALAATKFALCVGINEYSSGAGSLSGCVNDAGYFYANLLSLGGWLPSDMTKLTNGGATRSAIRDAMADYAATAVSGDTFVYMHSSHGGWNYPDYSSDEYSTYLCTHESYYEDYELAEDLSQFKSGVKIVVIVDACHSGGLFKAAGKEGPRTFDLAERVSAIMDETRAKRIARGEKGVLEKISSSEIGWVTAADYDQTSYDGGSYDSPDWMDGGADGNVPGAVFLGAFTWGWWNGDADRTGAGDGDGCMDGYEGWKYGYDYCSREYPGHIPQYFNETALRRVELGKSGEMPPSPDLATALDNTSLSFATGGDAPWNGQIVESHDGADAARSGAITDGQSSWLETTVTGAGILSFWWKVSSERNYDWLDFFVDGELQNYISGSSSDWECVSAAFPDGGTHVLKWVYSKDDEGWSDGEDCGWVDQISYSPLPEPACDLKTALDSSLSFETGGDWDWFGDSSVSHDGVDAARSGFIGSNGSTWMQTTVTGPGRISFWWKVSSEKDYDTLDFFVDETKETWISGNDGDWVNVSLVVWENGTHVLKWMYSKDKDSSRGSDCAWVDQVSWSPVTLPAPVSDDKYALCVGINDYDYSYGASPLSGCVNDAVYFRRNLTSLGGWKTSDMTTLTNAGATKTAIRDALARYAATAVSGDTFVYMHSSHGGWNDAYSTYLCTYNDDYDDYELAEDLSQFKSGVKIVVIVDACHSGGLFKAAGKEGPRTFDLAERVSAIMDETRAKRIARGEKGVLEKISSSEIGWVTAADYDQTSYDGGSYDSPDWMDGGADGNVPGAVFLGAFTWGWWNGDADGTGVGDGDGCMDAYEGWKYGYDYCSLVYPGHIPQCHNASALRRVELGRIGMPSVQITFNANGGTCATGSRTISVASAIGALPSATRAGFTLLGWYTAASGGSKITADSTFDADRTLYAHWAKTKYKVAFKANGGKGKMAAQTMTYGKAAKLRKNAFTRNGWVFMGWAKSKSGAVAYGNQATVKNLRTDGKTTTLYAKWAKKTYKVAFNANGGKGKMADQTMTYGKSAKLRKNAFTRSGWVFIGWAKSKSGAVAYGNQATVKNLRTDGKTTTLYAKWAKKTYKVAFNANGGTGRMAAQTMTYGQSAKLRKNAFSCNGKIFKGWAKTRNGNVAYKDEQSVKNLRADGGTTTLYAIWEPNLSPALDSPLSFSTGGTAEWFVQSSVTHDGIDAVQSGSITDGQSTWITTTVSGEGTVSFWWKVSSESSWDYLDFFVDDSNPAWISGTDGDWEYVSMEVSGSGSHVLKWMYSKDGSNSSGSDCGWLDQVVWTSSRSIPAKETDAEEPELVIEGAADGTEAVDGRISVAAGFRSGVFAVTASNGEDASAVADGDERTAWTTDAADGAWVVLTFAAPRVVEDVEVLGEALPDGTRILLSEDADEWEEEVPAKAQYVWVVFPACDAPLTVKEIRVLPEK